MPKGTYLISNTLRWGKGQKRQILQGQSRDGTVIRLKDSCAGFEQANKPKGLVWTGTAPAQRFRNGLRNLTLDTGKNNPGAIGAQFIANNQGGIRDVMIRSGDGQGPVGLDLAYTGEQGPLLIKDVEIVGFDLGVKLRGGVNSATFERVTLRNQNVVGILNEGQVISLRLLKTYGKVPALKNLGGGGVVTLLDSEFHGMEATPGQAAIVNEGGMFLRQIKTTGFGSVVQNSAGGSPSVSGSEVVEWVSHPVMSLFKTEAKSLNLPIKETPEIAFDPVDQWANVTAFGPPRQVELVRQADGVKVMVECWTPALQKAIDSGATTVYFPNRSGAVASAGGVEEVEESEEESGEGKKGGKAPAKATVSNTSYYLTGEVMVRGKVRRIIGCESDMGRIVNSNREKTIYQEDKIPKFVIEEGEGPVVIERFNTWYASFEFQQKSKRPLVISSLSFYDVHTTPGSGDVFLEDVRAKHVRVHGSSLWGRQVNPEGWVEPRQENQGGTFWILGLKTETDATVHKVTEGGRTEICGAFHYANKNEISPKQIYVCENSSLSVTMGESKTSKGKTFDVLIRQVLGTETKEIRQGDAPQRAGCSMIPLFCGEAGIKRSG
ncbi:MAG: hypothetical protein HC904_02375 [Blastochloris sp.]|nr:hypothetical protein [Blastochloris sp.]